MTEPENPPTPTTPLDLAGAWLPREALEAVEALEPGAPDDAFWKAQGLVDAIKKATSELAKEWNRRAILWLEERGGSIELRNGEDLVMRYHVSTSKGDPKCLDLAATAKAAWDALCGPLLGDSPAEVLEKALELGGGDIAAAASVLSEALDEKLTECLKELAQSVLSTGCFKPAATREAIGLEHYSKLFREGQVKTFKLEDGSEQPIKQLSEISGGVANRLAMRRKASCKKSP